MARLVPGRHGGTIKRSEKGDKGGPGRPPKLLTEMVREMRKAGYERVGPSSVMDAIETMIGLPEPVLKRMAADVDAPMAQRIIAQHLAKKSVSMLFNLLERAHGKAKQQLDVNQTGPPSKPLVIERVITEVRKG
jgi:hypothetical protein